MGATCDDGIANGGESGVDCGGFCGACRGPDVDADAGEDISDTHLNPGDVADAQDTIPTETCVDGIQNQGETGIDCGGPCAACPPTPTCVDGIQNQGETGIDCGGPCAACPPTPTCVDGIQNQGETGIDCGGPCAACPPTPTCVDGIQNQGETGIDCGGPCAACPPTPTCVDGIQNQGETGIDCGGPCAACPPAPTCVDGIQNQGETGIDCGGPCPACQPTPTCVDGIRNQGETGIDCGGPCPACEVGPTCSDGVQNQGEAGVDCGGPCPACPAPGSHTLTLTGLTLVALDINDENAAIFEGDSAISLANGSSQPGKVAVELWANSGLLPTGGTYNLASGVQTNYRTCDVCVRFKATDGTQYFQRSGALVLKSGTASNGNFLRSGFTDVELVEVTLDASYNSTHVPNGRVVTVRVMHDVASATGFLTFPGAFSRGPNNTSSLASFSTTATYTPIVSGAPEQVLYIAEFRASSPGGSLPAVGTYQLGEGVQANMATCTVCTWIQRQDGSMLFQANGTAALTNLSATTVSMAVTGQVIRAVTLDVNRNSTPVVGGPSAGVVGSIMSVR